MTEQEVLVALSSLIQNYLHCRP